jgi:hypothetical protein
MIVKIQPSEQWTGIQDEDKAVYLDVPDSVDVDSLAQNNPDIFYYGQNPMLLIQELMSKGAKVIECPIKIIVV